MSDSFQFPTLPLASLFKQRKGIEFYRDHVKRMIIVVSANGVLPQTSPDFMLETLHRIFKLKKKVIENLAVYAEKQVEENGRTIEETMAALTFFVGVLFEQADANNGQPLRKDGL